MPNRLVRDPHLAGLVEEYGRSIIGKALPDDPTVAKIIALSVGVTKILSSLQSSPRHLSVPDAPSWEEFLQNARTVYRNAHPPGKRGRKLTMGDALVWVAQLEYDLKRQPTRKEIMTRLADNQHFPNTVSERIAERIAQLYARLLSRYSWYGRTELPLSKEDVQWLRKNLTLKQRSSDNWWTQILEQWQHAKLEATGFSREIREAFSLSSEDLTEQRKKFEALRLQLTFGKQ